MIASLRSLFRAPDPKPRDLRCVSYADADRLCRANEGWRIAPEEDRNRDRSRVYLERDAEAASGKS